MSQNKTYIKEIFTSVQGEGPYIGCNQLFIRFSKCNLKCKYCDTDFISNLTLYTPIELFNKIKSVKNIHSISLTGAEPLCDSDFIREFLEILNKEKFKTKIYLETNGTLYNELEKIIKYVDIISMDIKLNSSSNNGELYKAHNKFIETAVKNKKEIFLKVVFDENISKEEIKECIKSAEKNNLLIVLQPKMNGKELSISNDIITGVYNDFIKKYPNVRIIPQVHKFLNLQ